MKRIIIICITAIICAAIFATPLYYQTFFKTEAVSEPQAVVTTEIKDKYLMVGDGEYAIILNQEFLALDICHANFRWQPHKYQLRWHQ